MAIATEKTAETFLDIVEGVPANCIFPLFADDEVEVVYGSASLIAVPVTDYVVDLSSPDYDQFTVTPTASLITKIEDLIADDEEAVEINYMTVRRKLDLLTSATPEGVRQTAFLSREIDRIHMKLIQLSEGLLRALKLPGKEVGDEDVQYSMDVPTSDTFAVWNADGTKLISGPTVEGFQTVVDNIENVNTVAEVAEEIVICADNIAAINTVADEIEGVGNVAALAGLSGAADKLAYFTGAAAMALTAFGSYGRSLVGAATASAARTVLELGSAALQSASAFATAAQGATADTALQPGAIGSTVFTQRTITAPAAGISVANGNGVSGNPTLSLANDLSALEGLASTGLAARTASDTWAQRTITGGGGITVTNGDGVSGNPTLSISNRRSIFIPASVMRPAGPTPCADLALVQAGSQFTPDFQTLDFQAVEFAQFGINFPKGFQGTVSAKVLWSHPATTTNFNVRWGVTCRGYGDGDSMAGTDLGGVLVTDTGGNTDTLYVSDETQAMSTNGSYDELTVFKIGRQSTSNNLAVDARLHGVILYYTINTLTEV